MVQRPGGALVDFGNVIIAHWLTNITQDNFDSIKYNFIPEVPGAFESLRRMNGHYGGNLLVVYNATNIAEEKIRKWLLHHEFATRTGIPLSKVVRSRSGRDKSVYMHSVNYPIDVVIDDRLEVLSQFIGKVPQLFLFRPRTEEVKLFNHKNVWSHVHEVWTWAEIIRSLRIP